jgi:hypothetical protein
LIQDLTATSLDEGNHQKTLVQYHTAESLDQGNHDRNPWFSNLLQHPSIKEITIETLGSVPYCSIPSIKEQRNYDRNPWFRSLLKYPSIKGNHDRNYWFSTLLQHPSIKEIMIETVGSVPYCSNHGSRKSR